MGPQPAASFPYDPTPCTPPKTHPVLWGHPAHSPPSSFLSLSPLLLRAEWAEQLTKMGRGKHFIGDFLPPDELEKFMETFKALKVSWEGPRAPAPAVGCLAGSHASGPAPPVSLTRQAPEAALSPPPFTGGAGPSCLRRHLLMIDTVCGGN